MKASCEAALDNTRARVRGEHWPFIVLIPPSGGCGVGGRGVLGLVGRGVYIYLLDKERKSIRVEIRCETPSD